MGQPASKAGSWLDGLMFNIGDPPGGGGGAAAGGGPGSGGQGFSLSHDEAMSMLNLARGIRDDLAKMIPKAERLTHLNPPAEDPASKGYNALLSGSGAGASAFGHGLGHIQRERDYVSTLIERLEKALHITQSSDDDAAGAVQNAANASGGLA